MEPRKTNDLDTKRTRTALSRSHKTALLMIICAIIVLLVHEFRLKITGSSRTLLHSAISLSLLWVIVLGCLHTLNRTRHITRKHVVFLCTGTAVITIYNLILFQPSVIERLGSRVFTGFFIGYEALQIVIGTIFVIMVCRTPERKSTD